MNKAQALKEFKVYHRPVDYKKDKPKHRLAWQMYTDSLHREGLITDKQRNSWGNPPGSQ